MILHQGVYLPDGERHLTDWMDRAGEIVDGRGTYQIKKLRRALSYCTSFRTAVDVGGHVGLWSMQLVKQFQIVHAFEPVAAHRECFRHNVDHERYICKLHAAALGDHVGHIDMHTAPTSSGDSWVNGDGEIPLLTMDSFGLTEVDFIKVDTEGYELFALRGGEETIKRWLPVIIVEQKPGRASVHFGLPERGAVEYLQSLGYRLAAEMSGDFILVPPPR